MKEREQSSQAKRFAAQERAVLDDGTNSALTTAQREATRAADSLRRIYQELGIDKSTIEELYNRQTHGTPDTPLTRANTVFLTEAAAAAATVALPIINQVRDEHSGTRQHYYEIFLAESEARKRKKETSS